MTNNNLVGHGFFRKSKAYGLVCGIALGLAFLGGKVNADEIVVPDGTDIPVVAEASQTIVEPTSPSSDVTEVTDDNGVTTNHTGDSDTQTESNTEPSEAVPNVDDAGGVTTDHTVPTTDGGTTTVTPDTSVPTNNPNISAETAVQAEASQVDTTSQVTGQVVQDVTSEAPVYTNTGVMIVSTQNGSVVLADGTITSPEAIGATTNSDGTISVTTSTGDSTTLPMTGEASTVGLSLLGSVLAGLSGLFFKKRQTV